MCNVSIGASSLGENNVSSHAHKTGSSGQIEEIGNDTCTLAFCLPYILLKEILDGVT